MAVVVVVDVVRSYIENMTAASLPIYGVSTDPSEQRTTFI